MKRYTERPKTAYEHAWEIRDVYGFKVVEDAQVAAEFRRFLAGRASTQAEGPSGGWRWRSTGCSPTTRRNARRTVC
jgi:hypothetical protein